MTDRQIAIKPEDDVQGHTMNLQQVYQSWADHGAFLKSYYASPRPAPSQGGSYNDRTPPHAN